MTIASSEINLQSKHDLICHAAKIESCNDDVMALIWSFLPYMYGHERFEMFEINTRTCTFKIFCLQAVIVDSLMTQNHLINLHLKTTIRKLFKGPFSTLMLCTPCYLDPEFCVTRNYQISRSQIALIVPRAIFGIVFFLFL